MTRPRYTYRLMLLVLAILAGIAMEHGQKERLAKAEKPMQTSLVLDG